MSEAAAVSAEAPTDFDWELSPDDLARMHSNARARRRKVALNAAARVAAPGTPADRVLASAAAFYDYLATDVAPEESPAD